MSGRSPTARFLPSADGGTFQPLSDAAAAALVTPAAERIPANATANHTPGPASPATVPWGPWATDQLGADGYLAHVTGHYNGTTDEILQWAAHKWGLDPDWVRAQAVQESSWHQAEVGDDGASYGILQVRVTAGDGGANSGWGGYPYVRHSTALCADFQCAYIRWVFDGHFYDYGRERMHRHLTAGQSAAAHGWDYVMWGALGSWYSGEWYTADARRYIGWVQDSLAKKTWLTY